jgi:hypothetical protein
MAALIYERKFWCKIDYMWVPCSEVNGFFEEISVSLQTAFVAISCLEKGRYMCKEAVSS